MLALNVFPLSAEIRAAFDFGTKKIKMQVAEVHGGKVQLLFNKTVENPIMLDERCWITKPSLDKVIDVISSLKAEIACYRVATIRAVATEVFRKAENGGQVIERLGDQLGFPIHLIDPQEEGRLAYASAAYFAQRDPVIVWDLGGGSSQIIGKKEKTWSIYTSPFGRVPFYAALVKKLPLIPRDSILDWALSLFKENANLKEVIAGNKSKAIGIGATSQFLAKDATIFSYEEMLKQHEAWVKSERPITQLESDRILGLALMLSFGIQEVEYSFSPGNTVGLLLDASYWPVHDPN